MELLRKCWWPNQKRGEKNQPFCLRANSWTKFIVMPSGAVARVRVVSMKDMLNVVMGGVLNVERIMMTTSSVTCCVDENVNECDYSTDERPYVRLP